MDTNRTNLRFFLTFSLYSGEQEGRHSPYIKIALYFNINMSLTGFNSDGTATINGLTTMSSNIMNTDELFIDASTTPINVGDALDAITVDVTALQADVATLQSEMNAVEADVATLQGEMNAVEADVATLQSDVTALTISTGITAATVAGLVVSQAAQDVTIAAQGVSIAALQLEDLSLDTRIDALEVKTTDQSWGSLTGTTFSTKVNVGGGSGVVLNTASASEFNSGIVCSSIASTSATTNIDIGSALTTGDVNLGSSAAATGVALNWGGSSNSGNLTFTGGSFTLTSSGIYTQRSGPTYNMVIGDTQTSGILNLGTGTSRTGAINIGTGATATSTAISIGNQTGAFGSCDIGTTTVTVGKSNTATNNIQTSTNGTLNLKTTSTGGAVNMGTGMTSGTITIGRSDATASTAVVNINSGSAMTGSIGIGNGASAKAITIGSSASTNTINGTTTIAGTTNINTTSLDNTTIGNGAAGGNFTVNAAANSITGTTNTVLGTTNINVTGTSATSIGNTTGLLAFKGDDVTIDASDIFLKTTGATNGVISLESSENISLVSVNDDVYINEGASSVMNTKIGNTTGTISLTGSLNTVLGTTDINKTGVSNTNIGNTTGVTTVTGQATFLGNTQFGDASADAIVPNGTLTKPFIIGTYASQSSYSTTSTTSLTTYLGGTLESVKTFTNSATGNFRYIMASVSPFDANGGITLTGGTYMFWLAINFEDGSSFNLTDLTMGLSTVSTLTSASSEATIIASLPNLTCFFHKTDAGDASVSDSEQRVLSSCFNLASSTTVYPFYFANHSVTVDSVQCNTVFVKIGSA